MIEQKRILIIDASKELQEKFSNILKEQGYEAYASFDGASALKSIETILPDLIIFDALASHLDANQFLKQVDEAGFGKKFFYIVLSEREKMRDYFDTIGVDGFLEKPVEAQVLLAEVTRVFLEAQSVKAELAHKRVLVIGRVEECVLKIVEQLKGEGCHTDFVLFGGQVISKAVLFLPNVIIMESRMIDMSSNSLIKILRQMPQFKRTPILIYNYFDGFELQNTNIQQQEMALSFFVQACLDQGATESIGTYNATVFVEKVGKYLKQGTIVVIDDDEGNALLVKRTLEKEGYQVFAARDAKTGFELVTRVKPHLIVLDIIMPEVDGYEVLTMLKNNEMLKNIPVMMMTVKDKDEDIQKSLDLGAEDYIVKPFYMNLFVKRVKSILEYSK